MVSSPPPGLRGLSNSKKPDGFFSSSWSDDQSDFEELDESSSSSWSDDQSER
jgi:hypothetical protein